MTRILVTGASGFIGSAVMRRLMKDGIDAVGFEGDLLADAKPDLSAMQASHCIHTAWYTNHADYLTHDINSAWVTASIRLAEAFTQGGGRRFLGLGTCLEYDVANAGGPCSEELTPLRPDVPYSISKLEVLNSLEQQGFNFAWARIFFVYGPGDRGGRLVPQMIGQFSRGKQAGPTNGGLRRDYIHVDDLAGQLVRIALSEVQGAINTGTAIAPTLTEMFAEGAKAFGRADLALGNDETDDQPPLIQADMDRFRRQVGDLQARDFAIGIKDVIA